MEQGRARAVEQLSRLFSGVWIASTALLGWISLILLRRMNITATGATVDQVLLRLAKQAGVSAVQATDIRRINKPRGLVIGTAGALVLVALTVTPIPKNKIFGELMLRSRQQLSLLGFFLLVRARRYFQIDADTLLAVDQRPPILLLRSFADDEKQKYAGSDKALLDFSLET